MSEIKIGVITASDRASKGIYEDILVWRFKIR